METLSGDYEDDVSFPDDVPTQPFEFSGADE